ncbi:MAG: hypothetical protein NDI61_11945 [Bdellovibrionaceae bacterium]|nr:hypothetical protein [Pseudobdellovibrionaceae bacterium]
MSIAFCVHLAVSSILAYAASALFGTLTAPIAAISLVVGAAVAVRWSRTFDRSDFEDWRVNGFSAGIGRWLEVGLFVYLMFVAYRHFGWMLYYSGTSLRTLHANNFGDLPLHLNYIRFFSEGAAFPPANPIFSPEQLRYPIGVDLYSALWEKLGIGTQTHFFVLGMLATLASLVALRVWAGWWGIGGFFLGGGWLTWNAIHSPGAMDPVAWKNLFLSVFITQRGMLFALPAGLLLLAAARDAFRHRREVAPAQLRMCGLIWGALALFHLHSFFAVSVILVGLAWIYRSQGGSGRVLRSLLIVALPVGSFFVFYLTDGFQKAGVAHWRSGWMIGAESLLDFLTLNFRFWLPLFVSLPFLAIVLGRQTARADIRKMWMEFGLYFGLFILFLNLMLAPWAWDNVKVLLWPYLGLLMLAHEMISPALAKARGGSTMEVALAAMLLTPGLTQVGASIIGTNGAVGISSVEVLSRQEGALKRVPRSAILIAAPTHDHPVAILGWRRVAGYEGHLWSHGIRSQDVRSDLELILRGQDGWREAAARVKATHILWGPAEKALYGDISQIWKSILPNVSPVAGYEVYEIQ